MTGGEYHRGAFGELLDICDIRPDTYPNLYWIKVFKTLCGTVLQCKSAHGTVYNAKAPKRLQ